MTGDRVASVQVWKWNIDPQSRRGWLYFIPQSYSCQQRDPNKTAALEWESLQQHPQTLQDVGESAAPIHWPVPSTHKDPALAVVFSLFFQKSEKMH
jgi:hypothetical protein